MTVKSFPNLLGRVRRPLHSGRDPLGEGQVAALQQRRAAAADGFRPSFFADWSLGHVGGPVQAGGVTGDAERLTAVAGSVA